MIISGIAKKKNNTTVWLCAGIGLAAAIVLAVAALLDWGPFAGEGFIAFAGWVVAALLHGALAALTINLFQPTPPQNPKTVMGTLSRDNLPDSRWRTLILLVPVLLATVAFDYWISQLNLQTVTYVGYAIASLLGIAALAWPTGNALFGGILNVEYAGASFGGAVTGVLLSLAVLIVASTVRHATLQGVSFPAMQDVTINGNYVALGDSYAAGEGLKPFQADTVKSHCDRSEHYGYSGLLAPHLVGSGTPKFEACSGSIVADIYAPSTPNGVPVAAQVGAGTYPDVKLVTIMSGGNDVGFSHLLVHCYEHAHCLTTTFSSGNRGMPPPEQLDQWGRHAIRALAGEEHDLYVKLRKSFPNARIIVIGYPYLFTAGPAPWTPDECTTMTRRFSQTVREWVRDRMDELDNMLYAETAETGLEFISPHDAWVGHEPCGSKGEFTNEINLGDLNELSGSFHPNRNGARELAVLIDTYLHDNPTPQSPFTSAVHPPLNVTTDFCPSRLGLKAPFGDASPRCP
jgi:hypothetical protein